MLLCPLCGKQNSLKHFDPSFFDDDVFVIVKRGLGKGKGFAEVSRYSILGTNHHAINGIENRVIKLVSLLELEDRITSRKLVKTEHEIDALEVNLESTIRDKRRLASDIEALEVVNEQLKNKIKQLELVLNSEKRINTRLRLEVEALEVKKEEWKKNFGRLEYSLNEKERENNRFRHEIEALEAELEYIESENNRHINKIDSLEEDLESLEDENNRLRHEIEALEVELEA